MISKLIALALTGNMLLMTSSSDGQKSDNYGYHLNTSLEVSKDATPNKEMNVSKEVSSQSVVMSNDTKEKADIIERTQPEETKTPVAKVAIDHSIWNGLLTKYVDSNGGVNYQGMQSDINQLNSYLKSIADTDISKSSSKEQLAYWINAYNAHTIKLILDNYPVASIMDIQGGKAFDSKWISINGEKLSLNDIENKKIRPVFNEPRIHFAVNCAAKSCPPLMNKAWTAASLEQDLTDRTIAFVNNTKYNKIEASEVKISKIFEWYASDFPSSIVSYLKKYSNNSLNNDASVKYLEYDWTLNKQ